MIVSDITVSFGYSQTDVIIDGLAYYDDWDIDALKPSQIRLNTTANILSRVNFNSKYLSLPMRSSCEEIRNKVKIMAKPECKIAVLDDMCLSELDPLPLCELDSHNVGTRLLSLPLSIRTEFDIGSPDCCAVALKSSVSITTAPSLGYYDDYLLTELDPYTLNELNARI